MSRAKKLCEDLNECVRANGRAYLTYTFKDGLNISSNIGRLDMVILAAYDEICEGIVLDHILMLWEDEMESFAPKQIPQYLRAIRDRLWGDYNDN